MYEPIIDALRRGAADEALDAARAAVAEQPQDPTAQRLLAMSQRLAGDAEAAIATIDHAIGLAPEDAELHFARAGMLLQARQLDAAQSALARSIGLDPNLFPAYIVQAQLALGRGDLDEAERIARTVARIAPNHPQVAAIDGTIALRRGDADRALAILSEAAGRDPEEPQLRHALGFAYLAKGHFAFAEQAFRSMLERDPQSHALRALVADVVRRQGRPGEAADELIPLLEANDSLALQRMIAELELGAGRAADALPRLRALAAAAPPDRRTLAALIEAWRQLGDQADARASLDAVLAEHPQLQDLWIARLSIEPFAGEEARAIVQRWREAMPQSVPAHEAWLTVLDAAGDATQAEQAALAITAMEPGHAKGELRVIDALLQRGDTEAALGRVESLLARADDPAVKRNLRHLLGRIFDVGGQYDVAAATWTELHGEVVAERLPLPQPTAPIARWPELAPLPDPAPGVLLLWGPPGSMVERIALTFGLSGAPLRIDRFGPNPPNDALQRYPTAPSLVDGSLDGGAVVAQWREGLGARDVTDGNVFDWLVWWDNALLLALRPHLPEARLMVALRDPRDMLLDWLAFGSPAPFALESPVIAARWLAAMVEQVAQLHEQDLFPHRLVKLDDVVDDTVALAQSIADAMQITLTAAPAEAFQPKHFPAGHWRAYAGPLADAFALLTPVAVRLGYPEA